MLDFDSSRVEFRVKGTTYYVEGITLDDSASMAELDGEPVRVQVAAMAALLASKARCDVPSWWLRFTRKSLPGDAIRSLNAGQQARIFRELMDAAAGVTPGES